VRSRRLGSGDASRRRRLSVALAATICASLGVVVPTNGGGVGAQTTNSACTDAPSPQSLDFLLPAWADQAGWSNPQQYETIFGADIDGDGKGELLGRNASNLEVFTWAPVVERFGPDSPGQWAASTVLGPPMEEADWFFDPSVYSTVQAADLDGDRADEVFFRSTTGVQVFDHASGAWSAPIAGPGFGDTNSLDTEFWEPQYYGTITSGDIDGDDDAEIIGRTSGGITSWAHQSDGTFGQVELPGSTPVMTDAGGWDDTLYSDTIQTADIDGDGDDDLIGLAPTGGGLQLYSLEVSDPSTGQGSWEELAATGPWGSADGWSESQFASTITTGDIDGVPGDEVIGLGPYGLDAYGWDTSADGGAGGWVQKVVPPTSGSPGALYGSPWTGAPYYSTLQTAELVPGQPAQVLARSTDGVHVLTLDTTTQTFVDSGSTATQFSDANGWNQSVRYPTIQTVKGPAGRGDLLVGRDATGMQTFHLPAVDQAWADPSAAFPSWTDPDAPDTERSRAYDDINDRAVTEGETVLGALQDLTADLDQLQSNIENLKPGAFNNVSRNTFEEVKQYTLTWTEAAQDVRGYLGVGTEAGAGLSQLLLDSFITAGSGASIDSIADNFSGSSTVLALIADLLWGAMGAVPGGGIFVSDGAQMAFTAAMSLGGSSLAAGMGFANTNGSVNAEAKDLQEKTIEGFCAGVEYLNIANGQVAANLGQLTAMAQMMSDGILSFTGTQFNDSLTAANTARQVWAYQQFSSMDDHGWRSGYCQSSTTCVMNDHNTWGPGWYAYKALPTDGLGTVNCAVSEVGGFSDVTALGVDPDTDIFMPWVPQDRSSVGNIGEPYDSLFQNGGMGILGWRIKTASCHS
jgi:hypothetical protein